MKFFLFIVYNLLAVARTFFCEEKWVIFIFLLLNRVFWFSKRSNFFQVNIFTDQLDFRLRKFKRLPLHESPTKHSNTTDWVFLTVRRLSIILLSYFSGFLGACYECFWPLNEEKWGDKLRGDFDIPMSNIGRYPHILEITENIKNEN